MVHLESPTILRELDGGVKEMTMFESALVPLFITVKFRLSNLPAVKSGELFLSSDEMFNVGVLLSGVTTNPVEMVDDSL